MKQTYRSVLRRRREGKTDYRKRRAMVVSHSDFLTVRTSNNNVLVQIASCGPEGDKVIASASSRELKKFGWLGSGKSLGAAYLTALLAGLKAVKKGAKEIVLYAGTQGYIPGSRISASVKGAQDAGLSIPVDPETFPSDERIKGGHIANYAKKLKDKRESKVQFSSLLKRKLSPEDYPAHFEKVKASIQGRGNQ